MNGARVPKIGDVVSAPGCYGTFWVASVIESGHTAVLRLIGREDYKESAPWGVLVYLDDNGEAQLAIDASLTRIRDMAEKSRERYKDQLQRLSDIEGAAFIGGNVPSPRETMTMTHRQLAADALAEFNELDAIIKARS